MHAIPKAVKGYPMRKIIEFQVSGRMGDPLGPVGAKQLLEPKGTQPSRIAGKTVMSK